MHPDKIIPTPTYAGWGFFIGEGRSHETGSTYNGDRISPRKSFQRVPIHIRTSSPVIWFPAASELLWPQVRA